jgi:hypothetical protein
VLNILKLKLDDIDFSFNLNTKGKIVSWISLKCLKISCPVALLQFTKTLGFMDSGIAKKRFP